LVGGFEVKRSLSPHSDSARLPGRPPEPGLFAAETGSVPPYRIPLGKM